MNHWLYVVPPLGGLVGAPDRLEPEPQAKRSPWALSGVLVVALAVAMATVGGSAAPAVRPEPAGLPQQPGLPDVLALSDGARVATKRAWHKREAELRGLFQHYMYGYLPQAPRNLRFTVDRVDPRYFGGKAAKKEVTITFGPAGTPPIHLLLVVPNHRRGPAPAFVGLNFCGNYTTLKDPTIPPPTVWMPRFCEGCTNNQATEAGRGLAAEAWSIEQSINRGYAIATFYNGDLESDRPDATEGVRAAYRRSGGADASRDWGCIAAWAWGLHRAVDYLVQDKDIDPKRIAVFGHSRNGKAALVAAAFDPRIALAIPHQAGCGGTAPSRGKVGESVRQINDRFPHWFNARFKQFNDQPDRLPFDQHCLVALCAPRPVLLSNATEDTWANPGGQFEMLRAAEPVYKLLKAGGLAAQTMPATEVLVDSVLGYYIRPGKHSTTQGDWKVFLDFADKHFKTGLKK